VTLSRDPFEEWRAALEEERAELAWRIKSGQLRLVGRGGAVLGTPGAFAPLPPAPAEPGENPENRAPDSRGGD